MANTTKAYKVSKLLQKGLKPVEVMERLKVSRSMVYRVRGEMVEDGLLDIISLQPTGVKTPKPKLKPVPVTPKQEVPKPVSVVPKQEAVKPKTLWQSVKEWFK